MLKKYIQLYSRIFDRDRNKLKLGSDLQIAMSNSRNI